MEYNLHWSTLTLSPIVEYLLMYRTYPVKEYTSPSSWRKVVVPERKLPRGFIVHANYTMRGLQSKTTYEVKIAAVNSQGEGKWSKLIHFSLNSNGESKNVGGLISKLSYLGDISILITL